MLHPSILTKPRQGKKKEVEDEARRGWVDGRWKMRWEMAAGEISR
jgi:hypothetical protein